MLCPLRLSSQKYFHPCQYEDCAWWVKDKCAIAILAETALPAAEDSAETDVLGKLTRLDGQISDDMASADRQEAKAPSKSLTKAEAYGAYSGLKIARTRIRNLIAEVSNANQN